MSNDSRKPIDAAALIEPQGIRQTEESTDMSDDLELKELAADFLLEYLKLRKDPLSWDLSRPGDVALLKQAFKEIFLMFKNPEA